jgi:uncharacterized membrane protein YraQ (UPF0718 family)
VAISTYAAFRGQGPLEMMLCRIGLSFAVAVIMASVVYFLRRGFVLRPDLAVPSGADDHQDHHDHRSGREKAAAAVRAATGDFLDVTVFFVLGAAVATLFNTSVNQQVIMPLAEDRVLAVGSMMALASLLSLCSTSDAFVAATFTAFPSASKLAFMVFGPVVDLKLIFIYGLVFRKRFIVFLVAGLAILVFVLCAFLPISNFRG